MNNQRHQRIGDQEEDSTKEIISMRQLGRRAKRKAEAEEKNRKKKNQRKYHEGKDRGKVNEIRSIREKKGERKNLEKGVNGAEE